MKSCSEFYDILTSVLYLATPLPDEDAELVRGAVELVVLVDAAAPHPQHVHVRLPRRVQQLQVVGLVVARRDRGRDPVRPLHEDRAPVHAEVEGEAAAEGLLHQLQRAEGHLLVEVSPTVHQQFVASSLTCLVSLWTVSRPGSSTQTVRG